MTSILSKTNAAPSFDLQACQAGPNMSQTTRLNMWKRLHCNQQFSFHHGNRLVDKGPFSYTSGHHNLLYKLAINVLYIPISVKSSSLKARWTFSNIIKSNQEQHYWTRKVNWHCSQFAQMECCNEYCLLIQKRQNENSTRVVFLTSCYEFGMQVTLHRMLASSSPIILITIFRLIFQLQLVGGWTNPSETYARPIGNLPQIGVKTTNI